MPLFCCPLNSLRSVVHMHNSTRCSTTTSAYLCGSWQGSQNALKGGQSRVPTILGRNSKGQTKWRSAGFCKNLRFPAVFCENLRFPAVFCENLRPRNAVIPRKSENLRKTANLAHLSLLVCPFYFPQKYVTEIRGFELWRSVVQWSCWRPCGPRFSCGTCSPLENKLSKGTFAHPLGLGFACLRVSIPASYSSSLLFFTLSQHLSISSFNCLIIDSRCAFSESICSIHTLSLLSLSLSLTLFHVTFGIYGSRVSCSHLI